MDVHFLLQIILPEVFFFISMLTVQEDAEPGAKSPVWNESLRQPSVRVHLQHLPRWALQHIFTYKYPQTHTHIEVLYHHMSHHIYMLQRLWGFPKHMLSSGETHSWCASLLLNQSDLVWRGETESPLALTAERDLEGGWWGVDRGQWETVPSGSLRHCIIHQEDSCVCLWKARLRFVTHSQPANSLSAPQVLHPTRHQHTIRQPAYQGCVHTDVPAHASKHTSVFSPQRSKI